MLDYDDFPRLISIVNSAPTNIVEYPVRLETFSAKNKYVGLDSELNHVEGTYSILIEAWRDYLETGRSFYREYFIGGQTKEELIDEIN
ncbi:hypothetical protein JOC86_004506 [Bacillus pakistanensis]|uniref:Uncharacterized protein n=1 Tax=Rossellomorea pakistanensis TaxID=992288 RepID=A0ABS2NJ96_9BACI|nr:hypothetical protein [Bacillus pakistanensis]MBM7587931.1 hypothetical protein [Bacillus pakistanensis]